MVKKVLFIDNTAHHVYGQMHLMDAFAKQGYSIVVMIPDDKKYTLELAKKGYKLIFQKVNGKSINPLNNIKLLRDISNKIKKIRPDLICSFTIKPNLYAAIAARRLSIPIIANITGLGYIFMKKGLVHSVVINLYKYAFKSLDCVFFQNPDDRELMLKENIFRENTLIKLLPGSGVNLTKFSYHGLVEKPVVFLFSGRLLWDKGIKELVEAMRQVKQKHPETKLVIIGNYFLANPKGIKPSTIASWEKEGILEYKGMVDDVVEVMQEIDCMVLPSYYREGIPRVLMEASSMGKPIITVDSIGCREVLEDNVNGFLAKPRDAASLAQAMMKFVELPFNEKVKMGLNGRKKMEKEFDQKIIIRKYLEVADKLIG